MNILENEFTTCETPVPKQIYKWANQTERVGTVHKEVLVADLLCQSNCFTGGKVNRVCECSQLGKMVSTKWTKHNLQSQTLFTAATSIVPILSV